MFRTRTAPSPDIRLRDIERYVSLDRFLQELERRGFRAVENRGRVVAFCNRAPIRRLL